MKKKPLHCRLKAKKMLGVMLEFSNEGQKFPKMGKGESFERLRSKKIRKS